MTEIAAVAEKWGLYAALTVTFVLWSYLREKRLLDRVAELENYIQNTLIAALNSATSAMHEAIGVIKLSTNALEDMKSATQQMQKTTEIMMSRLDNRPCLLDIEEQRRVYESRYAKERKSE